MSANHISSSVLFALFVLLLGPTSPASAKEELVNQVKKAIDDGVRYLREIENNQGSFEHTTMVAGHRPGGVTALAVVALLQSGVKPDDEIIKRCLKYLRGLKSEQTYSVGLQTMAFALAGYQEDRQRIEANLKWLAETRTHGGWGYTPAIRNPDHSINQYALLGIHEAHVAGLKIDPEVLRELHAYYNPRGATGKWQYRGNPTPTLSMTTAGLCNLLISAIDLDRKKELDERGVDKTCGTYSEDVTVSRSLEWIGREFHDRVSTESIQYPFYTLYGIERAGRLTGRRFFGKRDWYRDGCEYLIKIQKENPDKNGSWKGSGRFDVWPPVSTSLALLFLSKGRTPVLISKLAHGEIREHAEAWNNKRHDMRHVVEFCSRELFDKTPLAWQVFDPRSVTGLTEKELAEDLLQSPVVYLNGHTLTLVVGKTTEKILREYVENGGFIFAEACCGEKEFDTQFRELIKRITDTELAPLGAGHPVWKSSGKFTVSSDSYKLEGINKGCKTVVIYNPGPDVMGGWWENNDATSAKGKRAFHMAANIVAYATGMELPKPRLTQVEIFKGSEGKEPPRGYLQVAQLVASRNAMPLAPRAIPNLMQELVKLKMDVHHKVERLTFSTEDVLDFKFFYMHDRSAFPTPPSSALENLRYTLENRGTLLADAACGSKQFDASFRKLMESMWPKDKYPDRQLVKIDVTENQKPNQLFSKEVNGFKIETVKYRREEPVPGEKDRTQPSKDLREGPPILEGVKVNGRWVVIYCKYDIGCALEKHQSTDCLGHDYESAKILARAAILYALR